MSKGIICLLEGAWPKGETLFWKLCLVKLCWRKTRCVGLFFPIQQTDGAPDWGRQKGITPICSDLFRFPRFLPICSNLRSLFSGIPRFVPICSVFFRFVPICFQNKSEQIRETPFCRPLLQIPETDRWSTSHCGTLVPSVERATLDVVLVLIISENLEHVSTIFWIGGDNLVANGVRVSHLIFLKPPVTVTPQQELQKL